MEYLGGINLFTSHFIIGCKEDSREFTKTETIEIEALHKWIYFKDTDWGMERYRTDRTQYIDFLEIIELETFKEITEGLYQSYCKEFPYSTKKDFIKHVFDYTIFDLERFLKLDLHWLGEAPNEDNYSFYTVYSYHDEALLDFAIDAKLNIEHYKQNYKVILGYLKSFESNIKATKEQQKNETLPPQQIDEIQNRTKKIIVDTFENMDKKGWQYAFSTEQDYNLFADLLTNFFEYNPYTLPETTIQLKRTCKTKVAKALGEIHKELSNENKLSTDTEYFQLIRVLSHFEKEMEGDLYKALTR